jgi:hypothetical protein
LWLLKGLFAGKSDLPILRGQIALTECSQHFAALDLNATAKVRLLLSFDTKPKIFDENGSVHFAKQFDSPC